MGEVPSAGWREVYRWCGVPQPDDLRVPESVEVDTNMRDRIETVRQYVTGIGLWIRYGPRRVLRRVEERTGLPGGFWYVALLTVCVSAVVSLLVVIGAYRHYNRPEGPLWVSSEIPGEESGKGSGFYPACLGFGGVGRADRFP